MSPLRVVLVDDHILVRAGIRALLQGMAGVQVVAEASTGREAMQLVKKFFPDLVIMDIAMRDLNGLDAAALIKKETRTVRVIILSMHGDEEHAAQALRVGVDGYLLKDCAVAELEVAIRAAMRGETYLSPAVAKQLVSYMRQVKTEEFSKENEKGLASMSLSLRQREVLQLIAEGHTTKEIASLLHLSSKTVETHRTQLMDRLNIHDIAGLVRYAIRTGLTTLEP